MQKFIPVVFFSLMFFSSCKKDSVSGPIIGTWRLTNFINSGTDISSAYLTSFPNYQMKLNSDGSMQVSYTNSTTGQPDVINGTFELLSNNTKIVFTSPPHPTINANVLLLNNQSFNHIYESGGDSIERRFTKL
jgi:hypothetical protein